MENLKIIRPAGLEKECFLSKNLKGFEQNGFCLIEKKMQLDQNWPYAASSKENRLEQLHDAFEDDMCANIICARGGYGASDLLPTINWKKINAVKPKKFIGFSDISALHSAFYSHLGRNSQIRLLHAPMPSTELWDFNIDEIKLLLDVLTQSTLKTVTMSLRPINKNAEDQINLSIEGFLFGGCFSVLTNLIGTNYLPPLSDHILFFEDIGEHPARLIRYLNQWIQSNSLDGVQAIVLGYFKDLGLGIEDNSAMFLKEFGDRLNIPVWHSKNFGHIKRNMPLELGAQAKIQNNSIKYNL